MFERFAMFITKFKIYLPDSKLIICPNIDDEAIKSSFLSHNCGKINGWFLLSLESGSPASSARSKRERKASGSASTAI